ncbi:IS66 family insertion sequence element accessory protein TnpB [Collimonas humicola]|uniref:IS66 family insertion sequence element accessory protein TnpB n=1 Tax=Collimonas humicola TaxID=2825886 RepID=UPI0039B37FFC
MRCGFNGLAAKVQTALAEDPFSGHVFVFRGWRGDILKILWWTGDGLCLLAKRLERGRFIWRRHGLAVSGPAIHAPGRDRLAAPGTHQSPAVGLVNITASA